MPNDVNLEKLLEGKQVAIYVLDANLAPFIGDFYQSGYKWVDFSRLGIIDKRNPSDGPLYRIRPYRFVIPALVEIRPHSLLLYIVRGLDLPDNADNVAQEAEIR